MRSGQPDAKLLSPADVLAACDAAGWKFRRPPTNVGTSTWVSHHTYVTNVAGVDDGVLQSAASACGPLLRVTRLVPPTAAGTASGGATPVFEAAVLTYATVDDAQAAQAALDGAPPLPGAASTRPLVARLSELELSPDQAPSRQAPPPGPPAHTDAVSLGVPGVTLVLDFVTADEELELLAYFDRPDAPWEQLARRRVLHEGYRFDYQTRAADQAHPVGGFGPPVAAVLHRIHEVPEAARAAPFDQLTVNDYPDCMGIAAHVDTHSAFAPVLCSLSLASSAVIEFRRGTHRRCLLLPRRSLLLFADEARYGWSHGIPTRATDVVLCHCQADGGDSPAQLPTQLVHRNRRRVSLTFRRTLPPGHVCTCAWPEECDSRVVDPSMAWGPQHQLAPVSPDDANGIHTGSRETATPPPDTGAVPSVEVQHVWDLYERIAPHFSATRVAVWPAVRAFLCSLPPHSLLLDAGCGNGKYVGPALAAGHTVVGCDVAAALLRDCTAKAPAQALVHGSLFRADVASGLLLPLRPGAFDAVLCVAVLHHMSSLERRRNVLKGIARALKPGGRAIITAWATDQIEPERTVRKWKPIGGGAVASGEQQHGVTQPETAAPARQEYFVPWHVPLHRPEAGDAARHAARGCGSAAVPAAVPVVDAAKNTVVFQRYVHLFVPGELAQLAADVPGVRVEQEFFDASNWVIVICKAADTVESP